MKFMKIGTRPDTFYTEEATRTMVSDMPTDLILRVNNIKYLLHKFPLLPKCGLLQQICPDSDAAAECVTIDLNDVPGGEDGIELCAKYCYGIAINLSAHNVVAAFCAAKFLKMIESVEKGNFFMKLEAFFSSCILEGWKDSIIALQTTAKLPEWAESVGIVRKCIDSIVDKILTPPTKVSWSYTYTRPGYSKKERHSVPRDWWTEDISDLDMDLFRCIIVAVRSTNMLPPQLIGEALHVYAIRWLTTASDVTSPSSRSPHVTDRNKRNLEAIATMIPSETGSVSVGFLLRLISIGNFLGVSAVTRSELIRRASQQLDEATVDDLLLPPTSDTYLYDVDMVLAVVESVGSMWRRQSAANLENRQAQRLIRKVGKVVDSYLQTVAKDANLPVSKIVAIAEALPDAARSEHDELYRAINTYLKEHPDLSKPDKKRLCRVLDCQKLSSEVRIHAVKNERLPLRTVVQVLFFDQEKKSTVSQKPSPQQVIISARKTTDHDQILQEEGALKGESTSKSHEKLKRLTPSSMRKLVIDETRSELKGKGKGKKEG